MSFADRPDHTSLRHVAAPPLLAVSARTAPDTPAPIFGAHATRVRLERLAGQARYSRGWDLFRAKRVRLIDRREQRARGVVDGSSPYLVDVAVTNEGHLVGTCNCPDYSGGTITLCKHIVAFVLELAAVERAEATATGQPTARQASKPPPPYARPAGAYRLVGEAGRPPTASGLAVARGIPVLWHAHFADNTVYVWAEDDRAVGDEEVVFTAHGSVARHPRAADIQVVAGMIVEVGVSEGRPVELIVDVSSDTLADRYAVAAVALTAARAITVLAGFFADPRVALADDAQCLAALALCEVDVRGPRALNDLDRDRLLAATETLWVPSGAAPGDTVARFCSFAGRGADQLFASRLRLVGDYSPLVVLAAPETFASNPTAGSEMPIDGWSLHVAVIDPDGIRTTTNDGTLARIDNSPGSQALRAAARRCARVTGLVSSQVLLGAVALDIDQVLAVVARTPELERNGFRVQVPAGLPKPAQLSASVAVGTDRPAMLGLDSVCDFAWRVRADGTELSAADLAAIAAAKVRIVAIDGRWITAKPADLAALRKLFGTHTAAEALRLHAGVTDTGDIALEHVTLSGWLEHLAEIDERVEPVVAPAALVCELYDHQRDALAWLAFLNRCGIGGILADDMGLGKTVSVLALIAHDRETSGAVGPTLVVAPTSVLSVWANETATHAPGLTAHVHHGPNRLIGRAFERAAAEADLVVTNYDTLVRDRGFLEKLVWRRVVADEAQHAKNPRSRRAGALRALQAHQKICVTGTPIENGLVDLWSLAAVAMPGLLGSVEQFRSRFARPIQLADDEDAAETLVALLEPFLLARRKVDTTVGAALPALVERDTSVSLTPEQQALYDTVVERTLLELETREGIARRGAILGLLVRLKQIVNHPEAYLRDGRSLAGRSGKFEVLDAVLSEAFGAGERVLVFTQFVGTAELLIAYVSDRFGERSAELLCGATTTAGRADICARFGTDAGPRVLVVSLKAGGVGLTLTAATRVVLFDRWWNPAVEDQAVARAHRIGQDREVAVDKLVAIGTIEDKIAALLATKRSYAARVLGVDGDVAGRLSELDTAALRKVIERSG